MMQSIQNQGPIFLGLLTLVALLVILQMVRSSLSVYRNVPTQQVESHLQQLRHLGLLAAVLGMLGQGLGLYAAFRVVEQTQQAMAPHILWQGVAASLITTLYGLGTLAVAVLGSLILRRWHQRRHVDASPS